MLAPTVTVPLRSAPAFSVALSVTVPPPLTRAASALSHDAAPLDTVTSYPQCPEPLTATPPDPVPSAANVTADGVRPGDSAHVAAHCVTDTRADPIVTVPVRSTPAFAVTDTCTVPPPETEERSAEIQSRSSLTLNVHDDEPPAVADCVPEPNPNVREPVVPDAEQPDACVMPTRLPPIVTAPVRVGPVFSVTDTRTVPPPETDERSTEIQLRSSLTLNVHDDEPPTVADCVPDPLPKRSEPVVPDAEQPDACVMLTRRLPMLTVPVRRGPAFAVTDTCTVPSPDTDDRSTLIQLRSSLTR